jgi:hypothetical protein
MKTLLTTALILSLAGPALAQTASWDHAAVPSQASPFPPKACAPYLGAQSSEMTLLTTVVQKQAAEISSLQAELQRLGVKQPAFALKMGPQPNTNMRASLHPAAPHIPGGYYRAESHTPTKPAP